MLDELLYGKFVKYLKQRKKRAQDLADRTVTLDELKQKLTILASAVSGKAIEIFPAEREGGYKNNNFFLPLKMSVFESRDENQTFYFFRTLYLSFQHQLGLNWNRDVEMPAEDSFQMAKDTSPEVLKVLYDEFPKLQEIHDYLLVQFSQLQEPSPSNWLYGKWMRNDPDANAQKETNSLLAPVQQKDDSIDKTVILSKPVEEIRRLEIDLKAQEDYVLTHNFEKVDTADEFNGAWRDFDGEDELESHQNALDELDLRFTVRADDPAHSIYQAEFLENTQVAESATQKATGYFLEYDEWDYRKNSYRKNHCRIYPTHEKAAYHDFYASVIREYRSELMSLRKLLSTINNRREQHKRQTQGFDFDIDSVTDLHVDILSRHTPSEKIYLQQKKIEKDISILLLLDVSLSSDGYVLGHRVLDIEKQVAIIFGEILNEYSIDFSIQCFHSKTRNYSSYITIKDFDDPWSVAKNSIGGIQPNGYTRIGTSIRHSAHLLSQRPARKKWIILLSDGKPNDFDRYEGKYGIQDVKQALRELESRQINAFAIAIEAAAKYYLPQMFGQNNFQILSSPQEMLGSLVKLYEKMKYDS